MKKYISLILCLSLCLTLLAGCACKHTWVEATCVAPKTCSECDATEGEPLGHTWLEANCYTAKTCAVCNVTEGDPLGHTPGQWQETTDAVEATVCREQHCSVCNELTDSETVPLNTLVQDDLYLFTPNEFMKRLTMLADQYVTDFSYEFIPNNGLAAMVYSDGKQAILQFFRKGATLMASEEMDVAEVWCVSLIAADEADAALRYCFYMACDPALTEDAVFDLDVQLTVAYVNAVSAGERFGYYLNNELLYETTYVPEGVMGDFSMLMFNIYASDFR